MEKNHHECVVFTVTQKKEDDSRYNHKLIKQKNSDFAI